MADILKSPKSITSPISSNPSSQKIMSSPPPMPSFNPSDDIYDASTGAFDSGTQPPPPTQKTRPQLSDIIDEKYPSFDHQAAVVGPFSDEMSRESTFQEELSEMIMSVMLESHAWSSARSKHEDARNSQKFEEKILSVMDEEKEQERARAHLCEFVANIRMALARLSAGF